MKDLNQHLFRLLVFILILGLASCASFNPGWNYTVEKDGETDSYVLLNEAFQIEENAGSAEEVEALIDKLKEAEKADPDNYLTLWKIGNYHILMGAAYAEKRKDKKYHYREAIKYCEKAMCTNETFNAEVTGGVELTDAIGKLTLNEIDAMGYWYTARFYYFAEVLRPMGRVINTRIVIDNNKMIERIDELDRTWAGGGNYFSRGLYYISIPKKFGGSRERSNDEFATAIEVGPDYLVNRWGRAKYLYQLTGDQAGFITDLEWVIEQDPHEAGNPYPWNVYFQEDARKMLADSE
jgi:hypothetical protein